MVAQQRRSSAWTDGAAGGVPGGLDPQLAAPSWGNGATAAALGLSGGATTWSAAEVALWAFGEEADEVEACGSPLDGVREVADRGRDQGQDLAGLRDRLDFAGLPPEQTPTAIVDWVDTLVPVGLGVAGSGEFGVKLGFSVTPELEVSIVNQGGGWFEVEASGGMAGGFEVGEGLVGGDIGEKISAGVEVGGTITRACRVPWTRLTDPETLAALAASAVVGGVAGDAVEAITPAALLERLIGGHDLTPFLTKEEYEVTGGGELEGLVSAVGEKLALVAKGHAGLSVGVEYDDADGRDRQSGEIRFQGEVEQLTQILADLSKTVGVDTSATVIPHFATRGALVVPFTEIDGRKELGVPYGEFAMTVGLGPVDVTGEVGLGPGRTAVSVAVAVDPVSALWQKVLDEVVGETIELATLGLVEVETSGTLTLKLGVSLDHPAIVDAAAIAHDVFAWLVTGEVTEPLAPLLGVVRELVASAELELEADLVLAALRAQGESVVQPGVAVGGEGEAQAALVYQRDDVLGDLAAPPSVDEVLAMVRGGLPAIA